LHDLPTTAAYGCLQVVLVIVVALVAGVRDGFWPVSVALVSGLTFILPSIWKTMGLDPVA
jgi:hypothetical protein